MYFHGIKNLTSPFANKFYEEVLLLKKQKKIEYIGVSLYNLSELKLVTKKFNFDIVQIPVNIFDRRFLNNNVIKKLKKKGVKIIARSIFLKGVLLEEKISKFFYKWKKIFIAWNYWHKNRKQSKLQTCLNFIHNQKFIDKIIVGFNNHDQLKEVIKLSKNITKNYPKLIFSKDKYLLEPRLWKKN